MPDLAAAPFAVEPPAADERDPVGMVAIEITAAETRIDGRAVDRDEVRESIHARLDELKSLRASGLGEPAGRDWVLSVTADAPIEHVRSALAALSAADAPEGWLAFATALRQPAPVPRDRERLAALHDELGAEGGSGRAIELAKAIEAALPPCSAYAEVFRGLATLDAASRCGALAEGIADATVACKCPPDEDDLFTALYVATVGTQQPERERVLVETRIDPSVASPAASVKTWGDAIAGSDRAALARIWLGAP